MSPLSSLLSLWESTYVFRNTEGKMLFEVKLEAAFVISCTLNNTELAIVGTGSFAYVFLLN